MNGGVKCGTVFQIVLKNKTLCISIEFEVMKLNSFNVKSDR